MVFSSDAGVLIQIENIPPANKKPTWHCCFLTVNTITEICVCWNIKLLLLLGPLDITPVPRAILHPRSSDIRQQRWRADHMSVRGCTPSHLFPLTPHNISSPLTAIPWLEQSHTKLPIKKVFQQFSLPTLCSQKSIISWFTACLTELLSSLPRCPVSRHDGPAWSF